MSRLILVRHGQTERFDADGYTHLTALGRRQAAALARWLDVHDIAPDEVVVGPRERHQQSLAALAEALPGLPTARTLPGLDEHAGVTVLSRALAGEARGPDWAGVQAAMVEDGPMAAFLALMRGWAQGRVEVDDVEPWSAFQARVAGTLDTLCDPGAQGRTVLAVTSGGFVGVAVATVLGVSDPAIQVELANVLSNSSVTELRWRGRRRGLYRFHDTSHLGGDVPPTTI